MFELFKKNLISTRFITDPKQCSLLHIRDSLARFSSTCQMGLVNRYLG